MILGFDVAEQKVSARDNVDLVNKSVNYVELCFNFTGQNSIWTNLTKRVLFKSNKETYCKELDNNNKVLVPYEVLTGDYFTFTLYGLGTGDLRVTTNLVKVYLGESGFTGDTVIPSSGSKSIVDDIYDRLDNTVEMEVEFSDGTTAVYDVVVK